MPFTTPTSPRASVGAVFFSFSVVSTSSWPHGLWPARLLLSMEFSRQEYSRELPFPSPGNLPDPKIKPVSPALARWILYQWATWEAQSKCWLLTNPRLACVSSSIQSSRSPVSGSSPRPGDITYTASPRGSRMQFCGSGVGWRGFTRSTGILWIPAAGFPFLSSSIGAPTASRKSGNNKASCSTVMDTTGSAQTQDQTWNLVVTSSLKY